MVFWRRPKDFITDALMAEEQDEKNKDENQSINKWKQIKNFVNNNNTDSKDLSSRFKMNPTMNRLSKQRTLSVLPSA